MQDFITFLSHHPLLSAAVVIVFVLVTVVELIRVKRNTFNITPGRAVQLINRENAAVIDLRPTENYRKGHIIDAVSMTVQELKETPKKLEKLKNRPIILVGEAGSETQKIAALLLKQGYNAFSLAGGMRAWNEAELPLIKE
jgi:rhodanese-related sulfurtransferase